MESTQNPRNESDSPCVNVVTLDPDVSVCVTTVSLVTVGAVVSTAGVVVAADASPIALQYPLYTLSADEISPPGPPKVQLMLIQELRKLEAAEDRSVRQ
jgi:hypothetical protein